MALMRSDTTRSLELNFQLDFPPKEDSVQGQQEKARIAFNKIVDARYQDGSSGYVEVGVLLVHWAEDDLDVKHEVEMLTDLFQDKFGFFTEVYKIPNEDSGPRLYAKMGKWAAAFDGADKLSIIYYAGHGSHVDGDPKSLEIHGTRQNSKATTFFESSFDPLNMTDTDTLLIVDCCYAALTFSKKNIGKRKFELLCSVAPSEQAYAPKNANSFTKVLCGSLESLLEQNPDRGFSTSQLYRDLYHKCVRRKKPFLFDQSSRNLGWIYLRPVSKVVSEIKKKEEAEDNIAIELRLEMTKIPSEPEMKELAAHMQYLPLVSRLQFQHLHAPRERLDDLFEDLKRRQAIRPYIRIIRQKIAMIRNRKHGVPNSNESKKLARGDVPGIFDWSGEATFEEPGKPPRRTSIHHRKQTAAGESNVNGDNCVDSKPATHTIGNLLSYRVSFRGLNPYLAGVSKRYAELSPFKRLLLVIVWILMFFLQGLLRWFNGLREWARQPLK